MDLNKSTATTVLTKFLSFDFRIAVHHTHAVYLTGPLQRGDLITNIAFLLYNVIPKANSFFKKKSTTHCGSNFQLVNLSGNITSRLITL